MNRKEIQTSYLIDKFKGVYRLRAPYDLSTNQYPRKLNGTLEDIDVYIDCSYGNKVFHYGRSVLQSYIPSLGRGRNIVKAINETDPKLIFDIEETDTELLFKFDYKDSDKIIPLLKPKTSGANKSPFSSSNLPRNKYDIPEGELEGYKELINKIEPKKMVLLGHITHNFLNSLVTKKNTWESVKADMALKGLKGKAYIHSIGKWDEYIKYLTENIQE